MIVIPSINETTFEATKARVVKATGFLENLPEEERWVHVDISDGKFTKHISWNNPEELPRLRSATDNFKIKYEIHLMIDGPEAVLGEWFKAGADRIVIHLESLLVKGGTLLFGSTIVPAITPKSSPEVLIKSARYAKQILLLAVSPGPSGQAFDSSVIDKIKFLRRELPDVTIEIDGGINKETGARCAEAGAGVLVSANYIWKSDDSKKAFETLRAV
jgi:ribulose-phosphate 3-epimerase